MSQDRSNSQSSFGLINSTWDILAGACIVLVVNLIWLVLQIPSALSEGEQGGSGEEEENSDGENPEAGGRKELEIDMTQIYPEEKGN